MLEQEEVTEATNNQNKRHKPVIYSLYLILIIGVLTLGSLLWYFYPLGTKVTGEWTVTTVNGEVQLINQGSHSQLTLKALNGYSGMDLLFETELKAKGSNEYIGSQTTAYLLLDDSQLGAENVKELTANEEMFQPVSKNGSITKVAYTTKGVLANFGRENCDDLIKIVLRDFNWKTQKWQTLNLRNDSFASGGISFQRVTK